MAAEQWQCSRRRYATSLSVDSGRVSFALIFSLPLLLFVGGAGGSYLPFADESLAYRYFANVRVLDGQGGAVSTRKGN